MLNVIIALAMTATPPPSKSELLDRRMMHIQLAEQAAEMDCQTLFDKTMREPCKQMVKIQYDAMKREIYRERLLNSGNGD